MQATSPSPDSDKATWRRWLRAREIHTDEVAYQSEELRHLVTHRLREYPRRRTTEDGIITISSFAALPDEPNLLPLISKFPACRWCLPRIDGDKLIFHRIESLESLEVGAFGILEPDPMTPQVPLKEIDVFLCPGLAFGKDGSRLGRGKGFYDRALTKRSTNSEVWGIALKWQMFDTVPVDPHDCHMTDVISP